MYPWLLVGGCVIGLAALWLVSACRVLKQRRRNLQSLREQLLLHEAASAQSGDGPDREVAARMLEANRRIYREAARNYNRFLKKFQNRLPALLLRLHAADESGNVPEKPEG